MSEIDIMKDAGPVHDWRDNPFGLVYEYPITENIPGQVNINPVSYQLRGLKIVANVYTPADYDPDGKYPAITVAHPNGGTKEQTAGRYAQRLAELGYITIAADAAYQGHSEGEPRSVDKPFFRTDDIHGMADFLGTFPGVDPERMGALGICGGGGYTLNAAKSDKRFKAVATISMFNSGRVRRNGMQETAVDAIQDKLRQASEARALEAAGGEVRYAGDADLTDEQIAAQPFPLYREGYVYYWRTHACPGSTFKYTMSSLLDLMSWDATDQLELIDVPLLLIAGSDADTRYMSDDALEKATGTEDKELFLLEGAQHIETYWVDEYVDAALEKLEQFFGRTV
jgi:fermentation-respiration switch protein FrsA (DUF1100 family)